MNEISKEYPCSRKEIDKLTDVVTLGRDRNGRIVMVCEDRKEAAALLAVALEKALAAFH